MDVPTRYSLLRDRRDWNGATLVGLEADADGALSLLRLPGPADGVSIELPPPYDVDPSGVAVGPCRALFVADTAHDRVVFRDGLCQGEASLPGRAGGGSGLGQFRSPRGLAVNESSLWVADSGNARLQDFLFPALEVHALIGAGLAEPVGAGRDPHGYLYVLDRGLNAVVRFTPAGLADSTFNATLAGELPALGFGPGQFRPAFLAVAEDDTLYVSERSRDVVLRFDHQGHGLPPLPPPAAGWQPRALAIRAAWLYAFDAASGRIVVLDRQSGTPLGTVAGYRGPVSALAIDPADGTLYVKPGLDDRCFTFAPTAAFATTGSLRAGPLDAGEGTEWFRAAVEAVVPPGTGVRLEVFQNDDDVTVPLANDWLEAPALDTLLKSLVGLTSTPFPRRYLWLRVTLTGATGAASPTLVQVRAETPGESYMEYLPEVYRKHDALPGFLARLLELLRTEQGGAEEKIADVAHTFSADFAAVDTLPWLADWLAYELPEGRTPASRRALLHRVFQLYDRRGTPASLREFVWIGTGVRPAIAEPFRERAIWQLGASEMDGSPSRLGFDTLLPAVGPDGIVVADAPLAPEAEVPQCQPAIGSSVVGESAPLDPPRVGEPLFAETAHRFLVLVPAHRARAPGVRGAMERILDAEKPAHTEYHLCLVEPRMRVGFQARIGVDSIVAGECAPGRLAEAELDWTFVVGGPMSGPGRVGARTHLGRTTVLG